MESSMELWSYYSNHIRYGGNSSSPLSGKSRRSIECVPAARKWHRSQSERSLGVGQWREGWLAAVELGAVPSATAPARLPDEFGFELLAASGWLTWDGVWVVSCALEMSGSDSISWEKTDSLGNSLSCVWWSASFETYLLPYLVVAYGLYEVRTYSSGRRSTRDMQICRCRQIGPTRLW